MSLMEGFHENPDFELYGEKTPCFGVKLTTEQFDIIKSKEMDIVRIDGKRIFQVKDENGPTGEYMIFLVFMETK